MVDERGEGVTILPVPDTRPSAQKMPVAEVFGPTIQGEGPLAGLSTYFVRVGGCDYLCEWCDSLHAVLPEHVRELERLTSVEIAQRVDALPIGAGWVTLSGGNPAMYQGLEALVMLLHSRGLKVAVETQGSRWKDWLSTVDQLVVSPKPPSSGMASAKHTIETDKFMAKVAWRGPRTAVKIVVFDDDDYEWAASWFAATSHPSYAAFLSCGTDAQGDEGLHSTADRYRWLCEKVALDVRMRYVRVLPQLHVIAWGHKLGV